MGIEIINREALYSYSRWLMWGVEIQGGEHYNIAYGGVFNEMCLL